MAGPRSDECRRDRQNRRHRTTDTPAIPFGNPLPMTSLLIRVAEPHGRPRRPSFPTVIFGILAMTTLVPAATAQQPKSGPAAGGINENGSGTAKPNTTGCADRGEPMVGKWESCQFGGEGPVQIDDTTITLGIGDPLTGVAWTGTVPKENYRFAFEAKRIEGFDFFAAVTFPIGDGFATFVPGGWGGGVVGLSSINGYDASENETTQYRPLKDNIWYCFAVEVRPDTIKAFIDESEVFSVDREEKTFSLRAEMDLCKPIGIAAFQGDAVIRNIRLTELPTDPTAESSEASPSATVAGAAD